MTMPDDEYESVQDSIMLVSSVIEGLPLDKFLVRAKESLSRGPDADPALYARVGSKLQLIVNTAKHLRSVQALNVAARAAGVIK